MSKPPFAAAMGVVRLFAIFHGHAHGAEIPEDVGVVAYAAGFLIATAILRILPESAPASSLGRRESITVLVQRG
jgi:hydrogenase/urease accessory protein HupE